MRHCKDKRSKHITYMGYPVGSIRSLIDPMRFFYRWADRIHTINRSNDEQDKFQIGQLIGRPIKPTGNTQIYNFNDIPSSVVNSEIVRLKQRSQVKQRVLFPLCIFIRAMGCGRFGLDSFIPVIYGLLIPHRADNKARGYST